MKRAACRKNLARTPHRAFRTEHLEPRKAHLINLYAPTKHISKYVPSEKMDTMSFAMAWFALGAGHQLRARPASGGLVFEAYRVVVWDKKNEKNRQCPDLGVVVCRAAHRHY